MSESLVRYAPEQIKEMAIAVVNSGMFPAIKNAAQAMTLFMLAEANGLHPMKAALMYDVLPNGRPSMKGEAMLAEFQARGGTVKWLRRDGQECRGLFKSPGCPEGLEASFTIEEARQAQLAGKDSWRKYAADMLQWRCVTRGVKATLPAAGLGLYPTEVARDFDDPLTTAHDADLSPALEESIRLVKEAKARSAEQVAEFAPDKFDAKNAASLPLGEFEAPPVCTRDGCSSPVARYESESKQFPGRWYWQCEAAHNEKLQILEEGGSNKTANAAVSGHYRNWAEPWPREAVAPIGVANDPPARLTPEHLTEEVFEGIRRQTAERIAKEG